MHDRMNWRPLTDYERAVLKQLLAEPFHGRNEAVYQAEHSWAYDLQEEQGDNYGSVMLRTCDKIRMPLSGLLVEAMSKDLDGVPVSALLHGKDGTLYYLEFVKEDGTRLRQRPLPSTFLVSEVVARPVG